MKSILRSTVKCHTVTTGVRQPVCVFFGYERIKVNNVIDKVGQCETVTAEQAIKDADNILIDLQFLVKCGAVDVVANEVKYHHSYCKNSLSRAERMTKIEKGEKTEHTEVRDPYTGTFCSISEYVENCVIENKRP